MIIERFKRLLKLANYMRLNPIFSQKYLREERVSFDSKVKTGNKYVDKIKAVYLKSNSPENITIVLHGYTMRKEDLLDLGYLFTSMNISSIHPDLPYHGERGINGNGYIASSMSPNKIRLAIEQIVSDVKDLVDFSEAQGYKNIGLMGYSLGAITTMLMLGLEKRFKKGLAICGGGNIAEIIMKSPICADLAKLLEDNGLDESGLRSELEFVEPCKYAENIPKNKLFMLNGRFDDIVPVSNTFQFISSLKEKQHIRWANCNHFPPYSEIQNMAVLFGRGIQNG